MINSPIHTGENNQFGGVKEGLLREAYHVGIVSAVKTEPMKPASWHIAILSINRQISGRRNFFIVYPCFFVAAILFVSYDSTSTCNYTKSIGVVNMSEYMHAFFLLILTCF